MALAYISLSIISLLITIFGVIVLYLSYLKWIYRHIPGPKARSFFFGNVSDLRECTASGIYYHYKFLEWAQAYGPLYKVFFFHKVMLVATGASVIQDILTDSRFPKSKLIYTRVSKACGSRFLGNGLVTIFNHAKWKQKRHFLNPWFKKRNLITAMDQFNLIADTWVQKLGEFADGKTMVKMAKSLSNVTLDVIAKIGFSLDLNATNEKSSKFLAAFDTILEGMSIANKDPLMNYKWKYSAQVKRVQEAVTYVRHICQCEILNRLQQHHEVHMKDDMLSLLIKTKKLYPETSVEDIVDDFITILVAGQETTANSLAFLLNEIGNNIEIQTNVRKEIDNVVGDSINITALQLDKLDYTKMVIKETLRLFPPAPATVRDVCANTELEGYKLPTSSTVIFPFFVIHRLPQYYDGPHIFRPERWAIAEHRNKNPYLPFSLGHRMCAGSDFAMIEAKILICKFIQRFRFELDMKQSFEVCETTTLKPQDGSRMYLTFR